jgi:hypothetical protein
MPGAFAPVGLYALRAPSLRLAHPVTIPHAKMLRRFHIIQTYAGIHFRTDQEAGADLGRAIGTAVYKNNLRSVNDDE